jgi:site-specific DNA-methyltransferase (adenine-specific)
VKTDKVFYGDCMALAKTVPDDFVDLVVTSPPYADTLSYGDTIPTFHPDNYCDWFLPLFHEAARFLKPTGSFILNINDKIINKKRSTYVFELIYRIEKETGLCLHDRYVWAKKNGSPTGSAPCRLDDRVEYIFHFVRKQKNKKGRYKNTPESFKADIESLREPYAESTIKRYSNSTVGFNKVVDENGIAEIPRKTAVVNENGKIPTTVMRFNGAGTIRNSGAKHPAPFHPDLPRWFIEWLTDEGDVVLDPFLGGGTTAFVAKGMARKYLGFELNENYKPLIEQRLNTLENING